MAAFPLPLQADPWKSSPSTGLLHPLVLETDGDSTLRETQSSYFETHSYTQVHLTKICSEEKSEEKEAQDSGRSSLVACSCCLKMCVNSRFVFVSFPSVTNFCFGPVWCASGSVLCGFCVETLENVHF